jgi:ketosteroid isomerase-like protein
MTPTQIIESVYQAFGRGDVAHIVGLVAPGAPWRQSKMVPWGGDFAGPEGATEFFTRLDAAAKTTGFVVNENVEIGDQVFSFGRHDCILRATGKPASSEFMFRWRTRNGMIVSYESYVDSGAVVAALA